RRGPALRVPVDAAERRLLKLLDEARGARALQQACSQDARAGEELDEARLGELLARFRERGWLAEEGGRVLSLVLDPSERRRVETRRMSLMLAREGLSLPAELAGLDWLQAAPQLD